MNQKIHTIAIIGATGATGKQVLEGAMARGFKIRVLARTPAKLESVKDSIEIVKGSVDDLAVVKQLIDGVDVVLSTLGTSKKPNYIVEKGVKVILQAIEASQNKPRFIHMSAVGLGDSKEQCRKSWLWYLIVKLTFPLVGSELFADMERAEELIVRTEVVNYVILRAAILNDKEARGYVVRRTEEAVGGMFISRKDIAAFMLDVVKDTTYDGKAISLFSA